jgi:hypothetical protein
VLAWQSSYPRSPTTTFISPNAIRTVVLGKLHEPAEAQRAQCRIVSSQEDMGYGACLPSLSR